MTSVGGITLHSLREIAIDERFGTNERVEAMYRLLHDPLLEAIRDYKGTIDCEATAMDTWLKVLVHLRAFTMPETVTPWTVLQGWVYRIATNSATDQWRRERFRRSVEGNRNNDDSNEPVDPLPTLEDRYEHAETIADQRALLIAAMRSFSPRDLACVLIGGSVAMTPDQVMAQYRMTRSAVKSLRFRKFFFLRHELVAINAQREYPVEGIPGRPTSRIRRTKAQLAEAAVLTQRLADARPKPIGVAAGLPRYLHSQCHTTSEGTWDAR